MAVHQGTEKLCSNCGLILNVDNFFSSCSQCLKSVHFNCINNVSNWSCTECTSTLFPFADISNDDISLLYRTTVPSILNNNNECLEIFDSDNIPLLNEPDIDPDTNFNKFAKHYDSKDCYLDLQALDSFFYSW